MKGKAFNKTADWYKGDARYSDGAVRDMITKQLTQDRESLVKRLDKYRQATSCLNKEADDLSGRCDDFNKVIADTPPLLVPSAEDAAKSGGREGLLSQGYLREAQCRMEINADKHLFNTVLRDLATTERLTIATMGISSYAAAAKAAAQGFQAMNALGKTAYVASFMMERAWAVKGEYDAYKECKEDLNQADKLPSPDSASQSGNSCPASPYAKTINGVPNVMADYHACVMHHVAAAMNFVPFLLHTPVLASKLGLVSDLKAGAKEVGEIAGATKSTVQAMREVPVAAADAAPTVAQRIRAVGTAVKLGGENMQEGTVIQELGKSRLVEYPQAGGKSVLKLEERVEGQWVSQFGIEKMFIS